MNVGWGGGGVARHRGVVSRVSVGFQSIASGENGAARTGVPRRGAGEGEMSRARNFTGE